MVIPANPSQTSLAGKGSWFGGPRDPGAQGAPAGGQGWSVPIIAIYNRATLGGYWRVTAPNGKTVVVKQGDLGPHPNTGRSIDIGYNALHLFGYNEGSFPTDRGQWRATYLGKNAKPGAAGVAQVQPQPQGTRQQAPGQQGTPPGKLAALAPLLTAKSAFDIGSPKIKGIGDPTSPLKAAGLFNPGTLANPTQTQGRQGTGQGQPQQQAPTGRVSVVSGANRPGTSIQGSTMSFLQQVAAHLGQPLTVGTGTNHNQMTVDGRVSDHWDGHAADIPVALDSHQGDMIAAHALAAAGLPWQVALEDAQRGGLYTLVKDGHRIQVIWKTNEGGDHHNHVHIGYR